ncbi:unnamed protein product [Rhizoctonia solani]|uniref:Uncharacterized protein n=1 Tax=Rhizoctonia solani TaxID=456999 RepID=A0A8H3B8F9_9AGAM|nr:unnamed protein product [Rhizoctonia solani]
MTEVGDQTEWKHANRLRERGPTRMAEFLRGGWKADENRFWELGPGVEAERLPRYDHKLSTQLAQYPFTVQMAVYRNEYPSSIFPVKHTHTPPAVPEHISIALEPVSGAPWDEELESAHGVVRAMENLANSPSFDSTLSVKLSQHLFNIQFARYIWTQTRDNSLRGRRTLNIRLRQTRMNHRMSLPVLPLTRRASKDHKIKLRPNQPFPKRPTGRIILMLASNLKRQIDCLLEANRNLGANQSSYKPINKKGQLPRMYNLPAIASLNSADFRGSIEAQKVAGYLRFYDISTELIEENTSDLKPDQEANARNLLAYYLYYCPTASHAAYQLEE